MIRGRERTTRVSELGGGDHYLWELLYWMIAESDSTATNLVIDLLGFQRINDYAQSILGLKQTHCARKMLDPEAIAAGKENYTSAADQERLYWALYRGTILSHGTQETALDMLRRQRHMDAFLRYIPQSATVARKDGVLDHISHDSGIFELVTHSFYLGIFTWDGPSLSGQPEQQQFIGKLTRQIYELYG